MPRRRWLCHKGPAVVTGRRVGRGTGWEAAAALGVILCNLSHQPGRRSDLHVHQLPDGRPFGLFALLVGPSRDASADVFWRAEQTSDAHAIDSSGRNAPKIG